jgi:hypothetical protein
MTPNKFDKFEVCIDENNNLLYQATEDFILLMFIAKYNKIEATKVLQNNGVAYFNAEMDWYETHACENSNTPACITTTQGGIWHLNTEPYEWRPRSQSSPVEEGVRTFHNGEVIDSKYELLEVPLSHIIEYENHTPITDGIPSTRRALPKGIDTSDPRFASYLSGVNMNNVSYAYAKDDNECRLLLEQLNCKWRRIWWTRDGLLATETGV